MLILPSYEGWKVWKFSKYTNFAKNWRQLSQEVNYVNFQGAKRKICDTIWEILGLKGWNPKSKTFYLGQNTLINPSLG